MDWHTVELICAPDAEDAAEALALDAVAGLPDSAACVGLRHAAGGGAAERRLLITLRDAASRDLLLERLSAPAAAAGYRLAAVAEEDRDWVAEVAASEVAVPLGETFAALPGGAGPLPGRRGLRLPRSRAFGTGEHASTRLAAALLERNLAPGDSLLDVGTGTGVLAVMGRLLGAAPVVAVEKDPVACAIAADCLAANGVPDILLLAGTVEAVREDRRFSVIVANIERDVLLAAMPEFLERLEPGGRLILSGLLAEQLRDVLDEGRAWGGVELERRTQGEWAALMLTRRPASLPRVLVTGDAGADAETVVLPEPEARHLVTVRRTREGAAVEIVGGDGGTRVGRLQRRQARWVVTGCRRFHEATESPLRLTVLPALLHESGRMEALLRQAVELGAAAVQPVVTERCQSGRRRREGKTPTRWRKVVEEAVKQCGRSLVPAVRPPLDLPRVERGEGEVGVFLDPSGAPPATVLAGRAPGAVALLVGPEGGLTAAERRHLLERGWRALRLGPRILRTGTALAAAASLVLAAWGDLGRPGVS